MKRGKYKIFFNYLTEKKTNFSPNTGKYGPEKTPYLDAQK